MKQAKTLRHKIINHARIFDTTVEIYNQALHFLIDVIDREFPDFTGISTKSMVPAVEKLIHRTSQNPQPKYTDFNVRFHKFPSYFRRSAIATAYGKVKSYRSMLSNWFKEKEQLENEGKAFKKNPPCLSLDHKEFPVFYKGNMFKRTGDISAQIKVFHRNDWVWVDIEFKGQDLYKRDVWDWKECNPKLVRVGKKYFLHFSCEKDIKLNKTTINDQIVCAVDLGLTNSAVCSILDAKGTVLARTFINQAKEKDRLYRMTNKLKKAQRLSGKIEAPNFWRRIRGLQTAIVNDTCNKIVEFAKLHGADVIVFEYLKKMKVPKGFYGAKRLRFKLHYWRKTAIQNKVTEMAHYHGIRISRINARNTSALAYDGSGFVSRNNKKDLATFATGKVYHADLSASYNIGARYFLREILKPFPERERLSIQAKVPELAKRTYLTLASLISLHSALEPKALAHS